MGYRAVTPEQVLDVLRVDYELEWREYSSVPDIELTLDTTVRKYRWNHADGCEMWLWDFARNFNGIFNLKIGYRAWRRVLKPGGKRTLRDVCEFIARYKRVAVVEPVTVLGARCRPAGAFRIFTQLLRKRAAFKGEVAPSTALRAIPLYCLMQIYAELLLIGGRAIGLPQIARDERPRGVLGTARCVGLGELATVRDVCYAMAGETPTRRR